MKTVIVADSSGLISLASETDQNYHKAVDISKNLAKVNGLIIVPSDVFSETLNIAGKKLGHQAAISTAEATFSSGTFLILDTTEILRENAFTIFKEQSESVSFTDCVVMAVADHFETKEIFGFDEAFRRNGYVRLGIDDK